MSKKPCIECGGKQIHYRSLQDGKFNYFCDVCLIKPIPFYCDECGKEVNHHKNPIFDNNGDSGDREPMLIGYVCNECA
jgi:hypothetical protein